MAIAYRRMWWCAAVMAAACGQGCKKSPAPAAAGGGDQHGGSGAAAPTNRVDIPAPVRTNLGITFARVETRDVARTLRVPGRFELLPDARREYRLAAAGRVELLVTQYQRVEKGTALYRLDAPGWREVQDQIASAESGLAQAKARLESMTPIRAAHLKHEERLEEKVALWTDRLKRLQDLNASGSATRKDLAEAQDVLNATQAELADNMEKDAELVSREKELGAEVRAMETRLDLLFGSAAALSGVGVEELREGKWKTQSAVEIRAAAEGVVETLGVTNGAAAEQGALAVAVVRPERVRFRARALQADLGRLKDGQAALIVPPAGGTVAMQDAMSGTLTIGLNADADERTIELVATPERAAAWARAGVAGHLEVTLEGGQPELAIPLSCVVRDGARPIIFRRDPANADKVIRMDADVGLSDGRWVVIASGVREGDEIVLDGAYQLMLATAGNAPKGGHFHSDGTFHEGSH